MCKIEEKCLMWICEIEQIIVRVRLYVTNTSYVYILIIIDYSYFLKKCWKIWMRKTSVSIYYNWDFQNHSLSTQKYRYWTILKYRRFENEMQFIWNCDSSNELHGVQCRESREKKMKKFQFENFTTSDHVLTHLWARRKSASAT